MKLSWPFQTGFMGALESPVAITTVSASKASPSFVSTIQSWPCLTLMTDLPNRILISLARA
ncbi:hypothetical protein J2X71_002635 [Rhizobium sp. 1399]|nr:hypothetical protein [Rhizobium sp. 1399]